MCERDPVCDIPPIHGKSAKDTRAGRSAAVDMAEPGDTLEKIAADELARILKVTEVLKGIPDNAMRKARRFCCMTASYTTILLFYCSHITLVAQYRVFNVSISLVLLKYFFFYRSQEGGTGTFKSLTCSQCT